MHARAQRQGASEQEKKEGEQRREHLAPCHHRQRGERSCVRSLEFEDLFIPALQPTFISPKGPVRMPGVQPLGRGVSCRHSITASSVIVCPQRHRLEHASLISISSLPGKYPLLIELSSLPLRPHLARRPPTSTCHSPDGREGVEAAVLPAGAKWEKPKASVRWVIRQDSASAEALKATRMSSSTIQRQEARGVEQEQEAGARSRVTRPACRWSHPTRQ